MNKYCILIIMLLLTVAYNKSDVKLDLDNETITIGGNAENIEHSELPIMRQYTSTKFIPTVTPTSIHTPIPTLTPTPTPLPTIGPFGDKNGNPASAPELYSFADYEWRNFASHIVAGETGNSPQARRVVACTLVRDVLSGWKPYNLRKRWYAWKNPEWLDRLAVWNALFENSCEGLPWYRYVGNHNDRLVWISKGMIKEDTPYDVFGKTIGVR